MGPKFLEMGPEFWAFSQGGSKFLEWHGRAALAMAVQCVVGGAGGYLARCGGFWRTSGSRL
jgi:hypothetical protein